MSGESGSMTTRLFAWTVFYFKGKRQNFRVNLKVDSSMVQILANASDFRGEKNQEIL